MTPQLSLIVPAYNEVAIIQRTMRAISDFLVPRGLTFEVIVCADGNDGTREAASQLASEMAVKVLGATTRQGKGKGVREGMLAATGDIVGFLDADYKVAINEIEKVLPLFVQGYDVVIGSRRVAGANVRVKQPWYRRFGSKCFAYVMRPMVGLWGIADTQCGFKFFRAEVCRDLFGRQRIDGSMFDVEILSLALRSGYRVKEIGVTWQDDGDTRLQMVSGNLQNVKDLLRICVNRFRFARQTAPGLR
jgi:dolichyl-phosphate beta-glucosyltransferase